MNTNLAKRDFGSFHSSNATDLINLDDSKYVSPKFSVPVNLGELPDKGLASKYGSRELKSALFHLTDEFCFLNHGAFGASFKQVNLIALILNYLNVLFTFNIVN